MIKLNFEDCYSDVIDKKLVEIAQAGINSIDWFTYAGKDVIEVQHRFDLTQAVYHIKSGKWTAYHQGFEIAQFDKLEEALRASKEHKA